MKKSKKLPKLDWDKTTDLKTAKKQIISQPSFKNVPQQFRILNLSRYKTILDFGCGIGRNIPYILKHSNGELYAYDFPNMVELAHQYLGDVAHEVKWITTPITNLKNKHFELIIATLVFQHLKFKDIEQIFDNLNGNEIYVMGRGCLDDLKTNVWKILDEYLKPITPLDIKNGSEKHQAVIYKFRK